MAAYVRRVYICHVAAGKVGKPADSARVAYVAHGVGCHHKVPCNTLNYVIPSKSDICHVILVGEEGAVWVNHTIPVKGTKLHGYREIGH
jgi:hypothetical protein